MEKKSFKKNISNTSTSQKQNSNKRNKNQRLKRKWYEKSGWIIFWLVFFFPVGLYLMWRHSNWNKIIKSIISLLFVFGLISAGLSPENIEDIVLSADTGYNYNIYSEVPIEVETKPSKHSIPESAFSVSGGELEVSGEAIVFIAQQPGAYEITAEYEGVKSNTLVINYEDKEAIAQEEAAKAKAEEEAAAKAKAEEEAAAKAKAEEAAAKAKAEEEAAAKARMEAEAVARARAEEEAAAKAKAEEEARVAANKISTENAYSEVGNDAQVDTFKKEQMVWLSATGQKYHSKNNCGNMNPNNARQVTVSEAKSQGYGACSKCY